MGDRYRIRVRSCNPTWKPFTACCARACRHRIRSNTPSSRRWKGPQDHLEQVLRKLKRRADLTVEWAKRTPHVKLVPLRRARSTRIPSLEIPEDDLTFVTDLLKQKHVLVVHGSGFGEKPGTRHMRIVFLPSRC